MSRSADRFDQLTGAFDDPIAPSPVFAARLRTQLLAELTATPQPVAIAPNEAREESMPAVSAILPTQTPRLRAAKRPRSLRYLRWSKPMALVNVAAILLLIVGIARLFASDHPAPDSTYRLPAIASQTTGSPVAPRVSLDGPVSMWGANPGQTWNMAASAPDVSTWVPTIAVQGNGSPIGAAIIHNGMLYTSSVGKASGTAPEIKAVNMASGNRLWTTPLETYGRMAATNESLYVLHAISNPGNKGYSARLTALDTKTGQIRWEGPTISPLRDTPDVGPVIDGDRIYLTTPEGQVLVVDPQTGAQQAELGPRGSIDYAARDTATGDTIPILPGGSVAIDQHSIYAVQYDGSLVAYDSGRSTQQWTAELPRENTEAKVINARLMAAQGTIVVLADMGVPTGRVDSPYSSNEATLAAFDAANGRQLWTHSLPDGAHRMAVAAGNVAVTLGGTSSAPARVAAYDLTSGTDRWGLNSGLGDRPVWISAAGDAVYVLSSQGKVTEARFGAVSGGNAVTIQNLPPLPSTKSLDSFYGPLMLDNGSLYAIGDEGTVIKIGPAGPVSTPAAPPTAGTIASPIAMWGANPGQTWTFSGTAPDRSRAKLSTILAGQQKTYVVSSVVANDTLVLATEEKVNADYTPHLTAYDLATGAKRWTVERSVAGNLTAQGNLVFGMEDDQGSRRLIARHISDGSVAWSGPALPEGSFSNQGTLLVRGKLCYGRSDGEVVFVDPLTGTQTGTLGTARSKSPAPRLQLPPAGSIAFDDDAVYMTTRNDDIEAYNLQSNKKMWAFPLPKRPGETVTGARVAVSNGTVIISSLNGMPETSTPSGNPGIRLTDAYLTAIDVTSGTKKWSTTTTNSAWNGNNLVITGNQVVIADNNMQAVAVMIRSFDLDSGQELWDVNVAPPALPPASIALSAAGNQIYAIDPDQTLTAISLDDHSTRQFKLPDLTGPLSVLVAPQPAWIVNGAAYIVGTDGAVSVLSAPTQTSTPAASPVAAPRPSPVAVQPGLNAGQTNQFDGAVSMPKRMDVLGTSVAAFHAEAGPIVYNGTLYRIHVPVEPDTAPASVEAIALDDGSARTIFADPNHAAIALMLRGGQLLVVSNPVIGMSTDTTLSAVDPATSHPLWSLDLFAGSVGPSYPLLAGDKVFVADQSGRIHGVDLATHRTAWITPVPSLGAPTDVFAADGTMLYVATGYYLSALDQTTGATRWQADLSSQVLDIRSIGVAGGHIVVGGLLVTGRATSPATPTSTPAAGETLNQSRVLALSTTNHAVEWHWDTPDQLTHLFVFANGKVIVGHG